MRLGADEEGWPGQELKMLLRGALECCIYILLCLDYLDDLMGNMDLVIRHMLSWKLKRMNERRRNSKRVFGVTSMR